MAPHIGEKEQASTLPPASMAPQSLTAIVSPYTYTATRNGMLFVSGGTISLVQYGRGAALYTMSMTGSPIPMISGDFVKITYLSAPTLTFLPTQ